MEKQSGTKQTTVSQRDVFSVLGRYWKSQWRHLALASFFMAIAILLHIIVPLKASSIAMIPSKKVGTSVAHSPSDIVVQVLVVIFLLVSYHGISFYGHYLSGQCGNRVSKEVLKDCLVAFASMPWEQAVASNPAARTQQIHKGARLCSDVTERILTNIFDSGISLVCYFSAALYLSLPMTFSMVCIAGTSHIIEQFLKRVYLKTGQHQHRESELALIEGEATGYMVAALQRAGVVRVFDLVETIRANFSDRIENVFRRQGQNAWDVHSRTAVSSAVTNSLFISMIGVSAYLQMTGALEIGDIVAFFFSMNQLVSNFNTFRNETAKLGNLAAQAIPIAELLLNYKEKVPKFLPLDAKLRSGREIVIALSDASFSYGADAAPTSKNISTTDTESGSPAAGRIALRTSTLEFSSQEFVGIVGKSGSGKTTLLRLLAGLLRPTTGAIHCNLAYGSGLALLEQTPTLLPGTVRENILYGKRDMLLRSDLESKEIANQKELEQAAKAAGCHDFISALPDGYNTSVQNIDVSQLSGGQLQRICLARIFFSDAKLLLLDEPTTGLDAQSTNLLMKSVYALRAQGRTIVFVTHYLDLVKEADRILLVDDGQIAQQGAWSEIAEKLSYKTDLDA
jgi:ATP-binding cassette subfamily B protein